MVMGYACMPTLPSGSGGCWSRGYAQLGVLLGGPGRSWELSSGCFSPVGVWMLRLGAWFGVQSQPP